jgi:hypothetical protein
MHTPKFSQLQNGGAMSTYWLGPISCGKEFRGVRGSANCFVKEILFNVMTPCYGNTNTQYGNSTKTIL